MTPEQARLVQKAYENIRGAKGLVEMDLCGIAVSRAYYAVFYLAQVFLLSKELSFSKYSAVNAAFGQHFAKTGLVPKKFHAFLLEAQEERHVGDYDSQAHFSAEDAVEQITRAEEFLAFTEQWLKKSA